MVDKKEEKREEGTKKENWKNEKEEHEEGNTMEMNLLFLVGVCPSFFYT